MKGMIGVCEQLQRCALAKFLAKRLNLIERRQSVCRLAIVLELGLFSNSA
jgi:hypothetical protein